MFDSIGSFIVAYALWLALALIVPLVVLLFMLVVTQWQLWRRERELHSPKSARGYRWRVQSS